MERLPNSSVEKEIIYEILRACRLCGGGAGYKIPIIQNVVDLDGSEVELRQKIKECVQIEVHQDDKMPPLICELCVDKVNDFFEFLDMCRQINKRTRLRLGLPPQTRHQESLAAEDCILGVTEPFYVSDSDEPLSEQKSKTKPNDKGKKEEAVKAKKEPELRVKPAAEDCILGVTEPVYENDSDEPLSKQKSKTKPNDKGKKKEAVKAKKEPELRAKLDDSPLVTWLKKRQRERTPPKRSARTKKVKLTVKPEPQKPVIKHSLRISSKPPPRPILRSSLDSKSSSSRTSLDSTNPSNSRTSLDFKSSLNSKTSSDSKTSDSRISLRSVSKPDPKVESKPVPKQTSKLGSKSTPKPVPKSSPKPVSKRPSSPPLILKCTVCKQQFKMLQTLTNHMKCHNATFTSDKLACNDCQKWFRSPEETALDCTPLYSVFLRFSYLSRLP